MSPYSAASLDPAEQAMTAAELLQFVQTILLTPPGKYTYIKDMIVHHIRALEGLRAFHESSHLIGTDDPFNANDWSAVAIPDFAVSVGPLTFLGVGFDKDIEEM